MHLLICSANQEIPRNLGPENLLSAHNNPPLDPVLNPINPVLRRLTMVEIKWYKLLK